MNSFHQPSIANYHQSKLKVCGLTKLNQIQNLIRIKVDFLGFIFYEKSPRYVLNHLSLKQIAGIPHYGKVGVFLNENLNKIAKISEQTQLNFIQLHGDEDENFISELKKHIGENIKIIKVIRIGNQTSDQLQKMIDHQTSNIKYLLFDTDSKNFGGTGKTFDWNLLNKIKIPLPYFLSGGISEECIQQLTTINQRPFALDINSKFETEPGIKNINKIKEFIKLYNAQSKMCIETSEK